MIARDKIEEAFRIISAINQEAYRDPYLVSNEVLSKNPYNNNFLNRFLKGDDPKRHRLYHILYKLFVYYLKSSAHLILYLFRFIEYYLAPLKFIPSGNLKELVLIDVVFIMDRIEKSGHFRDLFFPGLEDMLKEKNKRFAYLPTFYSSSYNKRPLELYRVLKILKKDKVQVLTEYQLLSLYDILRLIYFVIAYPYHVLKLSRAIKTDTYGVRLVKYELIDTLDQVTFYSFSRYLQGRKIVKLPYERIKLISWYENRPVHKNLYMGMRTKPSKANIYGAQLFLYSKNYLTIIPDENEERFGLIPDKIITNGPYYIPKESKLNYVIGPSLRYRKVFSTIVKRENQKDILVLLPYLMNNVENILWMLRRAKLPKRNIFVKAHPGIPPERLRHLLPQNATIVEEDIYKLFESARLVIGSSSGTLLEATSLGIGVILIKEDGHFDYFNPLPEYGKGVIWAEVGSPEELVLQIEKFEIALAMGRDQISAIADRYKSMFFCEVTEEGLSRVFDIE